MANTIAAQMMPAGAVKGGSAMKFRFGDVQTRFTEDLDAARAGGLADFIEEYRRELSEGWHGFSGRLVEEEPAHPAGVPSPYVMRPYSIKLSYLGVSWVTVPLEIGHDEIDDADAPDWELDSGIVALFEEIGLPKPSPVPVMALHHQIAQKLHALTAPGSRRVHDLVDLQIMVAMGDIDYAATRQTCERLFAYRQNHAWPPKVVPGAGWETVYAEERVGVSVLEDLEEAVSWVNEFIERVASHEGRSS